MRAHAEASSLLPWVLGSGELRSSGFMSYSLSHLPGPHMLFHFTPKVTLMSLLCEIGNGHVTLGLDLWCKYMKQGICWILTLGYCLEYMRETHQPCFLVLIQKGDVEGRILCLLSAFNVLVLGQILRLYPKLTLKSLAKGDPELVPPLPLPPKCPDYRCLPPCSLYES